MPLELWGGLECTLNRTHDTYRDQTVASGHQDRLEDLDLFADLGLQALRYPVLWERTMPEHGLAPDWAWSDARLGRLRARRVRPIVGLVHHGSGPRHTHLLDDGFAPGLGRFAGLVAERYPWVEEWTPVNEPLTTARFSALYGHWYPHVRDERAFWLALLNQVDGTREAMRAIRRINPAARLIQTDDLGRTTATKPLADQAEFDNLRRWAGWDLLFGLVDRNHGLWSHLDSLGLGERLRRIADDPCPPDVVGVNHYLTSDRFLDHRLDRYPAHLHGGNGRMAFADTEAVRVLEPAPLGLADALREAWDRFGTPVALTEVHNGCTREEQLRWAAEAWDTAEAARGDGIDVRAVTAWSLLGSHGWNTLLTGEGSYETGVFDTSSGTPRPTALAALWKGLKLGAPRHPVACEPGWWRRPQRLIYGSCDNPAPEPVGDAPAVLIIGHASALKTMVIQACAMRGIRQLSAERSAAQHEPCLDVRAMLKVLNCWAVIDVDRWKFDLAEHLGGGPRRPVDAMRSASMGCGFIAEDVTRPVALGWSTASDDPWRSSMFATTMMGAAQLERRSGPRSAGSSLRVASPVEPITDAPIRLAVSRSLDLLIDDTARSWGLGDRHDAAPGSTGLGRSPDKITTTDWRNRPAQSTRRWPPAISSAEKPPVR